jgi:HSP20 family protein
MFCGPLSGAKPCRPVTNEISLRILFRSCETSPHLTGEIHGIFVAYGLLFFHDSKGSGIQEGLRRRETLAGGKPKETKKRKEEGRIMAKQEKEKSSREITPWRPLSEMARLEREMEQIFDDFFGPRHRPFLPARWWPGRAAGVGVPLVDVYEEKDEIVAKAELPGIGKSDIQVNISDHILTIRGEKKKEGEIKEEDYYCSERSYGAFTRTIELPKAVQVDRAKASFENGVLEIRLPKTEEAKKREIKVKID